jgi:hypothetical protein
LIKIYVDLVGLKLKKIVAELGFDPSPCVDGPLGYMFPKNSAQDPTATRLNWFRLRRKKGESVGFEVELFSVIRHASGLILGKSEPRVCNPSLNSRFTCTP